MEDHLAPRLAARAKLQKDPATGLQVLLFPEGLLNLNESAAAILGFCDGDRSLSQLLGKMSVFFKTPVSQLEGDVREFTPKA